jgi:hypothetical protein
MTPRRSKMVYSEEFLDGIYDEGYKARVEFLACRCPYDDRAMANAWWDGYDRATEDEGVFRDDYEVVF